jgi:hypothetical protein
MEILEAMRIICQKMDSIEDLLIKSYHAYTGDDRKLLREQYVKMNEQLLKLADKIFIDKK